MLYQRYLFISNLILSSAICLVLILLIWFTRASSFVNYITENGIELSKFFQLFILILPWLLMVIIPISIFTGTLININRMIGNNEISILKISGLTKLQICKPIILLALIGSILCYFLSFFLMPYANRYLRQSKSAINENYTNLVFKSQTFESFKNLTLYSKKRDENNNLVEVFLHDTRSPQYNLTITAKQGKIVIQDNSALLEMDQGTIQKFNYSSQKTEIIEFDHYLFNLSESNTAKTNNNLKPNEYFFLELFNLDQNLSETEYKKLISERHERIVDPLLSIVLTLIAVAFVMQGEFSRKQNSKNILKAIAIASSYFVLNIISYGFIKYSELYAILPYLNFFIFTIISFRVLNNNYRLKYAR